MFQSMPLFVGKRVAQKLAQVQRTGWVLRGLKNVESVADHMYRMGIMALFLDQSKTAGINKDKCIKMALVHDMAECIVGDITPWCGISKEEKHQQERKSLEDLLYTGASLSAIQHGMDAMDKLCKLAGGQTGQEILELWEEYSQQITAESKAVKDLDKFDMLLQAFEYEKLLQSPKKLQTFFDNNKGSFNSAEVNNWMEELQNLRTLHPHDGSDGSLPNNGYVKKLQE
ncbi:HD domain-containing protein 2-like isoform X2 [Limulus polyphemus]|uniref:5'-deoxynucleotidase HDDC2 n=1 Tax=Limulus polyphemus TaxID=6850 RepID=A0ABM1SMQ3_LIMPO|nr:HD domain-containing protein 2-like isoform X2 [Limulus polyphemus]